MFDDEFTGNILGLLFDGNVAGGVGGGDLGAGGDAIAAARAGAADLHEVAMLVDAVGKSSGGSVRMLHPFDAAGGGRCGIIGMIGGGGGVPGGAIPVFRAGEDIAAVRAGGKGGFGL